MNYENGLRVDLNRSVRVEQIATLTVRFELTQIVYLPAISTSRIPAPYDAMKKRGTKTESADT